MSRLMLIVLMILFFMVVGCGSEASKITPAQRSEAIALYEKYYGPTGYVSGVVSYEYLSPDDYKVPEIYGRKGYDLGLVALLRLNLKSYQAIESELINEKVMDENKEFKQQLLDLIKLEKEFVKANYYYKRAALENNLTKEDIHKYLEIVHMCRVNAFEQKIKFMKYYHHDVAQDMKIVSVGKMKMFNDHISDGFVGYSNGDVSIGVISSTNYGRVGNLRAVGDFLVVDCCVENNNFLDYRFNYEDFSLVSIDGNHQKVSKLVQEELERIAPYESYMKFPNEHIILKKGESQRYGLVFDLPKVKDGYALWEYNTTHKLCYMDSETKVHFEIPLKSIMAFSKF